MTLTEFLLARIAEDEEVAKDAALGAGAVGFGDERIANGKSWARRYHEVVRPVVPDVSDRRTLADCGGFAGLSIAPHIARHDPARALAECEAKRRIVEAFEDERVRRDIYNRDYPLGLLTTEGDLRARQSSNARCAGLEIALRALALPYADHPDYREEWRP